MKALAGFVLSLFIFLYSNTEKASTNFKEEFNKTLGKSSGIPELAQGEVVVINLWATWCGPCIKEIPEMNEIATEYKDKNVRFIAFSDETENVYETFLKKRENFQFEYELSFGNKAATTILKALDKSEYKGRAIPLHVLIDKNGEVADVFIGASPMNIEKIKSFLEANASAE
ncbi:TlpA family protein disulfide reductase [Belliella sp. DSM 107340]|uniref:TlpA family protein disulfide reductase n=1 Tax=Belliella calami TaxID=2923436 RepID=A0ABS9UUV0_9BACT|nr:TlpA disulfide reductase family protein [Belliella calami]MCH7400028.1 TlpA family protein disulfide reductase [Belliella calami]